MLLYRFIADLTSIALLLVYGLLCGQMVFLRISWRQYWRIMPVLWRMRLSVGFIRALVYWRIGESDIAITHLLEVMSKLEDKASTPKQKQTLELIYGIAVRMYMYCGYLEDVTLLLIRANRILRINSFASFPEVDINSAHLIRASLVAGKILRKARPKRRADVSNKDNSGKVIPFPKKKQERVSR